MAVPADRSFAAEAWLLITQPAPGRLAFALRLALICSLSAVVAEIYQTPEIALTVYLAFFLNKPDRTSSLLLAFAGAILVSVVIGILLLLAEPVLGDPGLRVLTMTVISFVMLFLASASKLKPLASTIALILAYALDVLGSAPLGEAATRALLYAWLFIGIPALVSALVNLFLAPSPRSFVQNEMAERLRAARHRLRGDGDPEKSNGLSRLLTGDEEVQAHLKLASLEKTSPADDMAALKGASDCLVVVLAAVQLMLDAPEAMPSRAVKLKIESRLEELASIFSAGGYPAEVEPVPIDDACSDLAASAVAFLNDGLTQFGNLRPEEPSHHAGKRGGFFLPDAFTNPAHVKFALKVTSGAMLCYLLYSILSWPGIHTALITCFIVSLGTAAESVQKLTLRIIGCLFGAGLGLLVMVRVVPLATSIGDLIVLVFAGAFIGAWIAGGDKRIAYAGFQIAFAYFLCVVQGSSPSFNMVVARDRVIGILLGNLVSYFVATRIWPVSVGPRIAASLSKLTDHLKSITEARDSWTRRRMAAQTGALLEQIESDARLAAYEPAWIRPAQTQLLLQQQAVAAAQVLEPPLLAVAELAPDQAPGQAKSCLERLFQSRTPIGQHLPPNRLGHPDAINALESLLCLRAAEFELAMSYLAKASRDA